MKHFSVSYIDAYMSYGLGPLKPARYVKIEEVALSQVFSADRDPVFGLVP